MLQTTVEALISGLSGLGMEERMRQKFRAIFLFYKDGFLSMTVGKTLWKIIGLKLFVFFAVFKLFFFQDYLGTKFSTDEERANYVIEQLTQMK